MNEHRKTGLADRALDTMFRLFAFVSLAFVMLVAIPGVSYILWNVIFVGRC